MSYVFVENVHKSFSQNEVLRGIDLSLEQGEHSVLLGASGSGKSTLLYLIGGLDQADQGKIRVGDKQLEKMNDDQMAIYRNRHIGFIFQFHFLLPSMNCLDNIYLPAKIGNSLTKQVKNRVDELAQQLQVEHCLKKFPYQLSGGEQQRINIIRALSLSPELLLCDEPTGNLDSKNSQIVVDILNKLMEEQKTTMLLVTHDAKIATQFERKITIEDGQIIS